MKRRDLIALCGIMAGSAFSAQFVRPARTLDGGQMTQKLLEEVQALRADVRYLRDIEEIRRLRMLYHYFINEGLLDRAPEIYTEDARVEWSTAGAGRGHKEIVELFHVLPTQSRFVKHFVSNHIVEVNGDSATGSAYVDARYASETTSEFIAAKYDEQYRRTPQGWKISETILTVYFKAALPHGWEDQVKRLNQFGA